MDPRYHTTLASLGQRYQNYPSELDQSRPPQDIIRELFLQEMLIRRQQEQRQGRDPDVIRPGSPSWPFGYTRIQMPIYPTIGSIGDVAAAAGALPPGPVMTTLNRLGETRRGGGNLGAYIGALGPRAVTGPPRGSPAGLPVQATEASPFRLTRERIQRELQDNPELARRFDANTTAEVGTDPEKRRWYQALTMDRAVQTGQPLSAIVNAPDYYPRMTTRQTRTTGMGVDQSLFEGANPANYATGNASFDPKTGRWVGFAGGPQTTTFGTGRGMELGGIEGQSGIPYAREMGYMGPTRTAIGPGGPQGNQISPMGGWETTVGAVTGAPGGVGYTNPARAGQGGTTDPHELVRPPESGFSLARFLANFDFTPAKVPAAPPFQFGPSPFRFAPLGQRRGER